MNPKTSLTTPPRVIGGVIVGLPALLLALSLACGGKTEEPKPPAPVRKLTYTDPTTGTYRLLKNAALSTPTHLVLDLTGSAAPDGAGIAFTFTVDPARAAWAKVAATDQNLVQNGAVFNLGTAPLGLVAKVESGKLVGALGQKGITNPAPVAMNGVLGRVALDLRSGAPTGSANLASSKAQVILADGATSTVAVSVGTLSTE